MCANVQTPIEDDVLLMKIRANGQESRLELVILFREALFVPSFLVTVAPYPHSLPEMTTMNIWDNK